VRKVFIAGCGYIGERIARTYQESGADVTCMIRSSEHASRLESAGFATITSALDDLTALPLLNLTDKILFYLVPPPGGGFIDTRARNFLAALENNRPPVKIIYMSTTSVYSETGGGVVTEESPTAPASAMGKRRLDAETAFLAYGAANDVPVIILRVSGIYGPGRLPLMQISQGQPLLLEAESGLSNRIHADDLAAICLAAAERTVANDIFNVSDGNPSSMTSYFNACADLLGYPRQPQVSMGEAGRIMSPLMFSYVTAARSVDNSRMLERLNIILCYPSMLEGLPASIGES